MVKKFNIFKKKIRDLGITIISKNTGEEKRLEEIFRRTVVHDVNS